MVRLLLGLPWLPLLGYYLGGQNWGIRSISPSPWVRACGRVGSSGAPRTCSGRSRLSNGGQWDMLRRCGWKIIPIWNITTYWCGQISPNWCFWMEYIYIHMYTRLAGKIMIQLFFNCRIKLIWMCLNGSPGFCVSATRTYCRGRLEDVNALASLELSVNRAYWGYRFVWKLDPQNPLINHVIPIKNLTISGYIPFSDTSIYWYTLR